MARAETETVEKHRDDEAAALCSARMEVRSISAGYGGVLVVVLVRVYGVGGDLEQLARKTGRKE